MEIVLATINAKWIHPSLALRLLKANLGKLEHNCEILEFALRQPLSEKVEPILSARPRLLGLSVSIWNHSATVELLKALDEKREAGYKPLIVLGGPEVSWLPEDSDIFRYADYVIRGEGEESFRSLCYRVLDGEGQGEAKPSGTPVFINQGDTVVDVNAIASPYRLYTAEDLQKKLIYVEASRGCPFGCEFCQGGMSPVREFPLEAFLNDMGTLIDKGGRSFKFLDRTFNLDIDRAKRIMEFFLERIDSAGGRPLCVHFEMVPSRFPPELREIIRRFPPGTLRLEVGIQSFNPQSAALISRSAPGEDELDVLKILRRETNALLHVDLIAGLPAESYVSFGSGLDRLWSTLSGEKAALSGDKACEIQLGVLKCLPGTSIVRHNDACGMEYSPAPPYELIRTGALSESELGKIKNFARFWEILVNRKLFPGLIAPFLSGGEPVFERFMELSDRLLEHFGRNWGIDREELKAFLELMNNQARP